MATEYGHAELGGVVAHVFRPAVLATGFSLVRLDDAPRAGLIDDRPARWRSRSSTSAWCARPSLLCSTVFGYGFWRSQSHRRRLRRPLRRGEGADAADHARDVPGRAGAARRPGRAGDPCYRG